MPELDPLAAVHSELHLRSEMPFAQTDEQLQTLLGISRHVDFGDGEHLYERGTPSDRVFMLTSGVVEIVAENRPMWRITNSGTIGFLDFMMGKPHGRTATSRGPTRVLEIDAVVYLEYLQDNVEIIQNILSRLSGVLFEDMLGASPGQLVSRPDPTPAEIESIFEADAFALVDRLLLLSRVPAFAHASVQALANLAHNARVERFAPGAVIATAGARTDRLSVLVRGAAELVRPGIAPIARGPIDLVCGVAELSTAPRSVTARATTESIVLQFEHEELLDRIDEHFELAQSLLAHVALQREMLNDREAEAGHTELRPIAHPSL
ncbi:MAG: cyclic nucleotide-binding domain-containing protein [Kofleriaceae bacterium]